VTGQSILDRMELLNPELQLQPGEADVARGLIAINMAQDYFESLAALRSRIKGGTVSTVVTANGVETTAFPTGVLRIDALDLLGTNNLPKKRLVNLQDTGAHAFLYKWPWFDTYASSSGEPSAYWTNGTSIYWSPTPNAVHTVRYYGFAAATDLTASGTFAYPDMVSLPLAVFATKVLDIGLDDPIESLQALATETFRPALDALERFNRTGALGFQYTEYHTE
jgi:hypothetical protein